MEHKHYFLKGLPASGKSTFSKDLLSRFPNIYFRVNKDDLRIAFYKDHYTKINERLLRNLEEIMIRQAVLEGRFVIWDNTHLEPMHEDRRKKLENELNISFEERLFFVSLEEAIMRDSLRPNSVGEKVITEMYQRYFSPKLEKYPIYPPIDKNKINCYIVDLDGTIAFNTKGRSFYDHTKVHEDSVNERLKQLLITIVKGSEFSKTEILIVSGRNSKGYELTKNWLIDNNIPFSKIFMRPENDNRPDEIIKEEIFKSHIEPFYNILGIFDDRLSVCRFWYSKDLPLYRVGNPDANF